MEAALTVELYLRLGKQLFDQKCVLRLQEIRVSVLREKPRYHLAALLPVILGF